MGNRVIVVSQIENGFLVSAENEAGKSLHAFQEYKDVAKHLAAHFGQALELAEDKVCPPCEKPHVEEQPQTTAPAEQPAGAENVVQQ